MADKFYKVTMPFNMVLDLYPVTKDNGDIIKLGDEFKVKDIEHLLKMGYVVEATTDEVKEAGFIVDVVSEAEKETEQETQKDVQANESDKKEDEVPEEIQEPSKEEGGDSEEPENL